DEAGEEEAHGGAAGERREGCALARLEAAYGLVGGDERTALGEIVLAAPLEAPGVEADGDVVGEEIRAGEIEVDDAGEFPVEEEGVVGEHVGVDRAAGQRLRPV